MLLNALLSSFVVGDLQKTFAVILQIFENNQNSKKYK